MSALPSYLVRITVAPYQKRHGPKKIVELRIPDPQIPRLHIEIDWEMSFCLRHKGQERILKGVVSEIRPARLTGSDAPLPWQVVISTSLILMFDSKQTYQELTGNFPQYFHASI